MNAARRSGACAVFILLGVPQARAASFASAARELSRAARRAGFSHVAVMPFVPMDASPAADGAALAEKFTTQFVRAGKTRAVERSLLKKLLEEHALGRTGLLDPSKLRSLGKIKAVDALVTGSFVTNGRVLTVNVRLVDLETGEVSAAGEEDVAREWEGAGAEPETIPLEGRPESPFSSSLALVAEEMSAPDGSADCRSAAKRADELQKGVLELQARYVAGLLRQGLSFSDLRRTPGLLITNQNLRWDFYDRVRAAYAAKELPALTREEASYLKLVEIAAERLHDSCVQSGLARR